MPQQSHINLDEKLVKSLQDLHFDKQRLMLLIDNPFQSNFPQLARYILHIFFEKPELRTSSKGASLQEILFECFMQINKKESAKESFQTAMRELELFYLSYKPSVSLKYRAFLDSMAQLSEVSETLQPTDKAPKKRPSSNH